MQHLDDGFLVAYLDGEKPDGWTGGRVDGLEHLGACAECQARLEALRATRDRAKAILRSGTPSGAQPSFQDVLRRRAAKADARKLASLRPLAWAATIVVAVGVGWYARELTVQGEVRAPESAGRRDGGTLEIATLPVDSVPKLAARQAPVSRAQREVATGAAGTAGATLARTKENEAANVVADRKDERTLAPVQLAADAPAVPPSRRPAEDDQLKKVDPRDTMRLNLDAVVATAVASGAGESVRAAEGEQATRRTRLAGAAPAAPPSAARAPDPAPALARGLADAPSRALEWVQVDLVEATRVLDRAPLTAPGLRILAYEVNPSRTSVRVSQRLASGTLELIQQRAGVREESVPSASRAVTGPGIGALVEGIQIRLWGPVSYDSLRALVAKLR